MKVGLFVFKLVCCNGEHVALDSAGSRRMNYDGKQLLAEQEAVLTLEQS